MNIEAPASLMGFPAKLAGIVGQDGVLTSIEDRRFFSLDFSEQPAELPIAVVKPRTVEHVSEIVRLASREGVAVNTRGGGMSYTRGHCPVRPETVILDAKGLNRIIEVNTNDRYVVLETGVTWAELREALRGTGYRVPYLGTLSGNIATVGGGLSQNATGMGRMTLAEHVLGLEIVLGDGRVLRTGSWSAKNTAPFYRYFGPDLTGMFLCDSGAFGIKTKVVLILEPWPKMAFGCATFDTREGFAAAQAAFARTNLHTECFAFDGDFVSGYAKRPAPPLDERRRMVRAYLADNPNKPRALRNLLRAWHPSGMGFLKDLPNAMYYISEAFDQKSADRMMKGLNRIAKQHGGRLLPTTIPFGLRYGPFVDVGELVVTPEGEVNFPINAKFPASKAVEVMRAFEAFVEENKPILKQHGIRLACNALLHGHFWGIEPVMFWRRPLGEYRGHFAPADRAAATADVKDDTAATAAAIDFRYRLTAMFRSMGSLHVQWAKAYPFADALEDQTAWDIIGKFKDIADPGRTLNPGLLGIP
jgi:D-lactate dehydrogenase (cytochrome)